LKFSSRAKFKNDLIPGKVMSDLKSIHISYGEKEHNLGDFEVLLNNANFTWVQASHGNVPANAVIGGRTDRGEPLYVARARHLHLTIPGKVHPSHKCAYIPCDWKEHRKDNYEVLVRVDGECISVHRPVVDRMPRNVQRESQNCKFKNDWKIE
jgi:hypothetical protein